jgi:hypothetical protein
MSAGDFNKQMLDVLDAIKPLDEVHAERLAKARERIQGITAEMKSEIDSAKGDLERYQQTIQAGSESSHRLIEERRIISEEASALVDEALKEQIELIKRIVRSTR